MCGPMLERQQRRCDLRSGVSSLRSLAEDAVALK